MAKIKGFAIRGLFRYLKENKPGSAPVIIRELSPPVVQILDKPILASSMYPYETFGELLRGIDLHLGRGDLKRCEEVGDFAARQDITGMFKVMVSVFSPKTTLERANLFWTRYCDTGKLVAISGDPKHSVVRLEGFPDINEAHCFLMIGWIRRFATITGGKDVVVKSDACVHHGAQYCQWSGQWT